MKKMKKFVSILLGTMLVGGATVGFTACGGGEGEEDAKYKYDITVWVGEDTKPLTEQLISKFNEENTLGIKFTASVNEVTESKAAGDVLSKPASAPEIFCFAQDQIARLVDSKLLAAPGSSAVTTIKAEHSASAVNAATVGDTVYAYPLTEDNGYFLYYDKSVITAEQADTIEGIIEACETNNKYFSFALNGGWYVASFFYGAGAKSEWTVDNFGAFTAYDDTFNSDEGMIAAKGLQKVLQSKRYIETGKASDFNAATPAGAVVSGIWDYSTAKNALGDNLGVAKLPSFEVDGKTYRLQSYLGCKMLGVTPQADGNKAAALSLLAQYLTNSGSQTARYEQFGWRPSAKTAQDSAAVKGDVALKALMETATVSQGQYPANWWTKVETLAGRIKDASTDTALQTALGNYYSGLGELLNN